MQLDGARVLITGGAGLIGSHLVDRLLETDVSAVVIFDNLSRGTRGNLSNGLTDPRCEVVPNADVMHIDVLDRAMRGVDAVCHLAALMLIPCQEYPRAGFEVNVGGTFNVLEAAARNDVKRFVFSSSASVYGDAVTIPMTEDHPYANLTVYGATKIAGEHLTKSLATRSGISWVGLRYMNVYGPRQDYQGAYVALIHEILDAIDRGGPVLIPGDGSQRYDFTSVYDVARANVLALASDVSGAFLNVATGVGTNLIELADLLMELRGMKVPISFTPSPSGLVSNRVGSIEAARSRLDFVAEVGLKEGLQRLIEWRSMNRTTMSPEVGEVPAVVR